MADGHTAQREILVKFQDTQIYRYIKICANIKYNLRIFMRLHSTVSKLLKGLA